MTYTPLYTSIVAVNAKTGLSATEVDMTDDNVLRAIIEDAEVETNVLIGRKFTDANATTEYLSSNGPDAIGNYQTRIRLSNYPVQSITEFKKLDIDGTAISTFATLTTVQIAAGTYATTDYWLEVQEDPLTNTVVPNGGAIFKTETIPKGTNNVKVSYTYGYTTVPTVIRDIATCLAGIRVWIRFLGGSYNRLDSYSIPQQNVDKGNFYDRGKANIQLLTDEANRLLDRVGRKSRTLFYASGSSR